MAVLMLLLALNLHGHDPSLMVDESLRATALASAGLGPVPRSRRDAARQNVSRGRQNIGYNISGLTQGSLSDDLRFRR
jgi:hypothetical protein